MLFSGILTVQGPGYGDGVGVQVNILYMYAEWRTKETCGNGTVCDFQR